MLRKTKINFLKLIFLIIHKFDCTLLKGFLGEQRLEGAVGGAQLKRNDGASLGKG